jgi:hypothetical protein
VDGRKLQRRLSLMPSESRKQIASKITRRRSISSDELLKI